MKKYKLTLNLEWELELPAEIDFDLNEVDVENELLDILNEKIALNNETVENLFWEGIEIKKLEDEK